MVDDPTEPNMTFDFVKIRLEAVFPGVKFEISKQVGGRQIRFWIWDFLTEISFCEHKVAVVDEVGVARASFQLKPGGKGAPAFTKMVMIRKPPGLQSFISWVQAYLNGIVAAIDMAQDGAGSEKADIFGGR